MKLLNVFLLTFLLLGCTDSAKDMKPEALVLRFLESPDYELLSDDDKEVWTKKKWIEYDFAGRLPQPSLLTTSRYFELEQHLFSLFKYNVAKVTQEVNGATLVTVTLKWPAVLDEVSYFDDYALENLDDKLENLIKAYKKGFLAAEKIKFMSVEETFTVRPDGIFINIEKIADKQKRTLIVDDLFSSLAYIKDYELDHLLYSSNEPKLLKQTKQIISLGLKQINKDINALETAIAKGYELLPDHSFYLELNDLEKLQTAKILLEADELFSQHLNFSNIRVSNTRLGYALFFDWSFSGNDLPNENVHAGYRVKYFDADSNQVGSNDFFYTRIKTLNGNKGGSIGQPIKNQMLARRIESAKVEYLLPAQAPRVRCAISESLECKID